MIMANNNENKVLKSSIEREQNDLVCSSESEKIKGSKNLNVPHLRFPEFSGEWEMATFGDIAKGFDYGMNAAAKSFDGNNKYIRITDIDEVSSQYLYDDVVSPDGELEDSYLVKENDILLARTGASTGKSYLYRNSDGKLYFAGFLIRANIYKHNSYFVFSQLHTLRYKKWISVMSARSGQPGINSQEYASFSVYTTSLQEEDKIATFLKLLDDRIATQSKVIEDLKKLKSAIYHRVFSTIKGRTVALQSIANIVKGKQLNGTKLSDKGDYYVMNGGIVPSGYYYEYNTPANTISISEGGNSCGYVQFNRKPFWSGGHCYALHIEHNEVNLHFLYHFLKYREKDIMALRIGSGLPNIQKKDLGNFHILLPDIYEQNKVVSLFETLQQKVDAETKLQKYLFDQKQYLLQQMFI